VGEQVPREQVRLEEQPHGRGEVHAGVRVHLTQVVRGLGHRVRDWVQLQDFRRQHVFAPRFEEILAV